MGTYPILDDTDADIGPVGDMFGDWSNHQVELFALHQLSYYSWRAMYYMQMEQLRNNVRARYAAGLAFSTAAVMYLWGFVPTWAQGPLTTAGGTIAAAAIKDVYAFGRSLVHKVLGFITEPIKEAVDSGITAARNMVFSGMRSGVNRPHPDAKAGRKRKRPDYFEPEDPWAWVRSIRKESAQPVLKPIEIDEHTRFGNMGLHLHSESIRIQQSDTLLNTDGLQSMKWVQRWLIQGDDVTVTHDDVSSRMGTSLRIRGVSIRAALHAPPDTDFRCGIVRLLLIYNPQIGNDSAFPDGIAPLSSIFDSAFVTSDSPALTKGSPSFGATGEHMGWKPIFDSTQDFDPQHGVHWECYVPLDLHQRYYSIPGGLMPLTYILQSGLINLLVGTMCTDLTHNSTGLRGYINLVWHFELPVRAPPEISSALNLHKDAYIPDDPNGRPTNHGHPHVTEPIDNNWGPFGPHHNPKTKMKGTTIDYGRHPDVSGHVDFEGTGDKYPGYRPWSGNWFRRFARWTARVLIGGTSHMDL